MKIGLSAIFFCLMLMFSVHALPVIDSFSGDLHAGQNVTILGSGFGIKERVEPLVWDDFEQHQLDNDVEQTAPVYGPNWNDWWVPDAPVTQPIITSDQAYSGQKSVKSEWEESQGWVSSFGQENSFGAQEKLYVTWRRYHDPSKADRLINYKMTFSWPYGSGLGPQFITGTVTTGGAWPWNLQNGGQGASASTDTYWQRVNGATLLQGNYICEGYTYPDDIWVPDGYSCPRIIYEDDLYDWHRWETYIEFDQPASANNGYIKTVYDHSHFWEVADANLWEECDTCAGNIGQWYFGHNFEHRDEWFTSPDDYFRTYWDDIYIDNTRARVELCDADTWDAVTHCEIQIPHSVWNDTDINFTVNLGSFTQEDVDNGLYLFVIDENGVASDGFPIDVVTSSEPVITSVSNTLSDGSLISIEGYGFGTKSPVAPILFDMVDNQPQYGTLDDSDNLQPVPTDYGNNPDDYYWTNNGNFADGNGDNVKFYSGPQSRIPGDWMYYIPADLKKGYFIGPDNNLPFDSDFYVSFWHLANDETAHTQSSTKLIRIWPDGSGATGRLSWTYSQWLVYDHFDDQCEALGTSPWISLPEMDNFETFNHQEVLFEYNGTDPCGYRYTNSIWVNRIPLTATHSSIPPNFWTNPRAAVSETGVYDKIERIGLDLNDPASVNPVETWFDDIYIDRTQARIVLGDAPVWEGVSHFELQIPVSGWDDGTGENIVFEANLGSFTQVDIDSGLYLFVVDADGIVSSGFGPLDVLTQTFSPGDLNRDGVINLLDLEEISSFTELLFVGAYFLS